MSNPTDTLRAFIAIRVMGQAKQAIGQPWKRDLGLPHGVHDAMKWESDYHITLRFLGDIRRDQIGQLVREVHASKMPPRFTLKLGELSVFPEFVSYIAPKVLWVGVEGDLQELHFIYQKVDDGVQRAGFPPADYPYTPHITIARFGGDMNLSESMRSRKAIREVKDYPLPVSGKVGAVSLLSSILEPKIDGSGSYVRYHTLHDWMLTEEGGNNADRTL